jgi:hypothetical protein
VLGLAAWALIAVAGCGQTTIIIVGSEAGGTSGGGGSTAAGGSAGWSLDFVWSSFGAVDGMACVGLNEPMEPAEEQWDDNYLCTPEDLGLEWSAMGPIAGKFCTHVWESSDLAHGWADNYLCAPGDLGIAWSPARPLGRLPCLKIDEDSDPGTWGDNHLCWHTFARRGLDLEWSTTGPIAGKVCVAFDEGAEPTEHGWGNAHLCSSEELGLYFTSSYPAGGDFCAFLYEPDDPHSWADNSLCSPNNLGLDFSWTGPIDGMTCLSLDVPSDPDGWSDNYLCWR